MVKRKVVGYLSREKKVIKHIYIKNKKYYGDIHKRKHFIHHC